MRVIAGQAKGHQLKGPKGAGTRPTSDKVREAIFAILESLMSAAADEAGEDVWEGARVLDLYAGTGALGIEALSRGAAEADFVESNPGACQVIRENLRHTRLSAQGRIHCTSVAPFLARVGSGERRKYDIVLMDPPYYEAGLEVVLAEIAAADIIKDRSWLVVEHAHRRPLPEKVASFSAIKVRRHGDTTVSIYVPDVQGGTA